MTSPETTKSFRPNKLIPTIVLAAVLATVVAEITYNGYKYVQQPSLDEVYDNAYTGHGKCLDGTPYDLANGAVMNVNHLGKSGQEIVSILPQAANSYTPSVLFFTDGEVNGQTKLAAADHQTQAFLIVSHCPDQPSGS